MGPLVVLAYSGGLDTSAIVPWLHERYGARVLCFAADVGQGPGELHGLVEKAKRSGAVDCVVADLRSEEHTSELQSHSDLVCRLLLEKKKKTKEKIVYINIQNRSR